MAHRDVVTGRRSEWAFGNLPVAEDLQIHLARCMAEAAGRTGTLKTHHSVKAAHRALRFFAAHLNSLDRPPMAPADLRAAHIASFQMAHAHDGRLVGTLKVLLRRVSAPYTDDFASALLRQNPRRARSTKESYSRSEVRALMRLAKDVVRPARARIRKHVALLDQWRRGDVPQADRQTYALGALLDHIDRHGDVPRNDEGKVLQSHVQKAGTTATDAMALTYLTLDEVLAFQLLLVAMTGQNAGTIGRAPAEHHRADDGTGVGVAITDLLKPRRGRYRAHMSVPLADIPKWLPEPAAPLEQGRKELLTPLGVYLLLWELTQPARLAKGSDRLFVWWAPTGGGGVGRGLRVGAPRTRPGDWAESRGFLNDDGEPEGLDFNRLRLSYLQEHDEPVAHTRRTLVEQYQIRDTADLTRYQRVVATTLAEQVQQAREALRLTWLTHEDLDEARTQPDAVAERLGVSAQTLERLISGRYDTVVTACSDNEQGPFTPGSPCQASFLMCTACPCAVSLPRHLPMQVAAHDGLLARRSDSQPLDWAQRYGAAWARLADLLNRHSDSTIAAAREQVTDDHVALIERLLNRELDA